jgi:hypothetical protein
MFSHIQNFNDFSTNESFLYMSPEFRVNLKELYAHKKDVVAKRLLDSEGTDTGSEVSFLDMSEKPGHIEFRNMRKTLELIIKDLEKEWSAKQTSDFLKSNIKDTYKSLDYQDMKHISDADWYDKPEKKRGPWKTSAQTTSAVKLINKMFPGEFTQKEVLLFMDNLKTFMMDDTDVIETVEGEEILKWFKENTLYDKKHTLGKSCMIDKPESFFDLYVNNPDVVKLVIITSTDRYGKKKLKARALVWKIEKAEDENGESLDIKTLMDRRYGISEEHMLALENHAREKGWAWRTVNDNKNLRTISIPKGGSSSDVILTTRIKNIPKEFPYSDTLQYIDPDTGVLSNKFMKDFAAMNKTNGTLNTDVVWSEVQNETIEAEFALWSKNEDTYIHVDFAITVHEGSPQNKGMWYVKNPNITKLESGPFEGDYVFKSDTVFSHFYDEFILKEHAVRTPMNVSLDGTFTVDHAYKKNLWPMPKNDNWFKVVSSVNPMWNDMGGIHLFITKDFTETLFPTTDKEPEFISHFDAGLLDIEHNKDSAYHIDIYTYIESLKKYNLFDRLLSEMKKSPSVIIQDRRKRLITANKIL